MKQYAIALLALLGLASCEKVVNVDLNNAEPKLVIEGLVNNASAAKVTISRSVPFSNSNSFPVVTGAAVSISDNAGNTYTVAGKIYTASSTMPPQVDFEDLFQDTVFFSKKTTIATAVFTDPAGFGNYYHFIETVNGKRGKVIFLVDDQFQDGGIIFNELVDEDLKLKVGDVVQVEMQTVDSVVFRYLRGLQDLQFNNTVPANPDTNIGNGALGFFSAHTSQTKTLVIR
jgi:hypothetical protein